MKNYLKKIIRITIILSFTFALTFPIEIYADHFLPKPKGETITIAYDSVGRVVGEGNNQYFQCLGNGTIQCSVNIEL